METEVYKQLKKITVDGRTYLGIVGDDGVISNAMWRKRDLEEDDLAEWVKLANCGMLTEAKLSGAQQYVVEDLTVEQKRQIKNFVAVMKEAKIIAAPQWENKVYDQLRRD